jgi:energy-coupling factor transporter transmembrane protein EcfT
MTARDAVAGVPALKYLLVPLLVLGMLPAVLVLAVAFYVRAAVVALAEVGKLTLAQLK